MQNRKVPTFNKAKAYKLLGGVTGYINNLKVVAPINGALDFTTGLIVFFIENDV
jgi:hypothetical protein